MEHLRLVWSERIAAASALPAWWNDHIDASSIEVKGDKAKLWRSGDSSFYCSEHDTNPGYADNGWNCPLHTAEEYIRAAMEEDHHVGAWWGHESQARGYGGGGRMLMAAWVPIAAVVQPPNLGHEGVIVPDDTPIEIVHVELSTLKPQRPGRMSRDFGGWITLPQRSTIRAVSSTSKLYWRVHPPERPFDPEHATSQTWHDIGRPIDRGYSCFDDPWHLWVYLDAARLYGAAKSQQIIAFSGERVGEGPDGEDLVVPDMKTVQRMSLADFERRLLDAPLPASPKKGGQGRDLYSSWAAMRRWLGEEFEPGSDPLVDRIMKRAMPSWRGLVDEPVWTMAPAVIIVDLFGRTNTYEVYVEGEVKGRRYKLAEAKAFAEEKLGALVWRRHETPEVKADHYYFGPTVEFTDPTSAYLGEFA